LTIPKVLSMAIAARSLSLSGASLNVYV